MKRMYQNNIRKSEFITVDETILSNNEFVFLFLQCLHDIPHANHEKKPNFPPKIGQTDQKMWMVGQPTEMVDLLNLHLKLRACYIYSIYKNDSHKPKGK